MIFLNKVWRKTAILVHLQPIRRIFYALFALSASRFYKLELREREDNLTNQIILVKTCSQIRKLNSQWIFLSQIKIFHIRSFCTLWKYTNVINHLKSCEMYWLFHRIKESIWKKNKSIVIKPSWSESSLGRWFKKAPKPTDIIIKWSLPYPISLRNN